MRNQPVSNNRVAPSLVDSLRERSEYHAADRIEELEEALDGARLQIEYLHSKFSKTGTGEAVLAQIRAVLEGRQDV